MHTTRDGDQSGMDTIAEITAQYDAITARAAANSAAFTAVNAQLVSDRAAKVSTVEPGQRVDHVMVKALGAIDMATGEVISRIRADDPRLAELAELGMVARDLVRVIGHHQAGRAEHAEWALVANRKALSALARADGGTDM